MLKAGIRVGGRRSEVGGTTRLKGGAGFPSPPRDAASRSFGSSASVPLTHGSSAVAPTHQRTAGGGQLAGYARPATRCGWRLLAFSPPEEIRSGSGRNAHHFAVSLTFMPLLRNNSITFERQGSRLLLALALPVSRKSTTVFSPNLVFNVGSAPA